MAPVSTVHRLDARKAGPAPRSWPALSAGSHRGPPSAGPSAAAHWARDVRLGASSGFTRGVKPAHAGKVREKCYSPKRGDIGVRYVRPEGIHDGRRARRALGSRRRIETWSLARKGREKSPNGGDLLAGPRHRTIRPGILPPPPPSPSNAKCAEVHRSPSLTVCQRPRALGQDLGRCGLDRACAGARGRAPSRVNGGLPAEERAGQGNPFLWLPFHLDRDFLTDGNNASLSV